MPDYITPPIETEPDDLSSEAFASLEAQVPGWLPNPGNLETWLIEALAQMAGVTADVASAVPPSIFGYFGASLMGLPPNAATAATATTTWVLIDTAGYTIPAGTLVGIAAAGDDLVPFEVAEDTIVAPGADTATGVVIVAQDPGVAANGLTGAATMIDALDFVVTVTATDTSTGGVDAETDAEYLNRLRALLTLMAPRPILPNDFAVMARQIAGVARATAIDLYNADTDEDDVPRCVTVVVAGPDGQPVSTETKDAVDALLQGRREVNFLVFVIDPTYTTINVVFTFTPYPDFDGATVAASAEAAVAEFLNPATFGAVPYGEAPLWLLDTKVRYLEVAEAINRTEGVWYIDTLTVNGGTTDVALAGPGPLPDPGSITGTAT
jgi:uncharacterized phage protein gp47/JayE